MIIIVCIANALKDGAINLNILTGFRARMFASDGVFTCSMSICVICGALELCPEHERYKLWHLDMQHTVIEKSIIFQATNVYIKGNYLCPELPIREWGL